MANANSKSVEKTVATLIRNTNVAERTAAIVEERTIALTENEIKNRAFEARVDEIAVIAGSATESMFDLSVAFQNAVRDGIRAATDAVTVYTRYARKSVETAREKDRDRAVDATLAEPDSKSFGVQVSILKGFAHPAVVACGDMLYATVDAAIKSIPPEMRKDSGNVKAYKRVNAAIAKLAKKTGKIADTVNVAMAKDMGFIVNVLMKSDADGDGTGETEKTPLSPLAKLGNVAKTLEKLSKEGFQDDERVINIAAYVAQLHGIITAESKNVGALPALV